MVENWRVKITTSRIAMAPTGFCLDFDASSIFTICSRRLRSCWMTSARFAATIVSVVIAPFWSRAVYE